MKTVLRGALLVQQSIFNSTVKKRLIKKIFDLKSNAASYTWEEKTCVNRHETNLRIPLGQEVKMLLQVS